jgi:hypothetical protein
MSNNPFESISDIYTESVKEADSAGLAEVYKQATDMVFDALKAECGFDITIEDVEYLDGYFIFGRGTNSVVHFHIKETPGWKYGIWWEPVSKSEDVSGEAHEEYHTDRLHCKIFAQYEEEIDKFKPSASIVEEEFDLYFASPTANRLWAFASDIKFIHDEPYLAFYREMHYTDFNREYVSRAKAKGYFERHFKEKKLAAETNALNDKEILSTLYNILKEDIDDGVCFIYDRGDNWTPRYEIVIKNTLEVEDGCYELFDLFEEADAKAIRKLWEQTIKNCEKRAKKAGCYWYNRCCYDSAILLSADDYDKAFEQAAKVDFTNIVKLEEQYD